MPRIVFVPGAARTVARVARCVRAFSSQAGSGRASGSQSSRQMRRARSVPPVSSVWPAGSAARERTAPVWDSVCRQRPLSRSQIRTVLSRLEEARWRPSRKKQTDVTSAVWPVSARTARRERRSQTRTAASTPPDAAWRPSGLIATVPTLPSWPSSTATQECVSRSQTRTDASQPALTA
jgi:hypothetical protein